MLNDPEDTARFERISHGRAAAPGPKVEAALTVLSGPNAGALFTLDGQRLLIGRSIDLQIVLSDPGLSRRHAAIERRDNDFYIEDLGSTNGTYVDGEPLMRPQRLHDGARIEAGEHTMLRFALHDALEQQAARRTHELMVRDPLTHVFNRRYLEDRLAAEVAYCERHASSLSLLLIDIDDFKNVNDNYGHDTGDTVLRALARTLTRISRAEDAIARYGGEEFVIVARGIGRLGAESFAERVRRSVELQRFATDNGTLAATVSIGVAHVDGPGGLDATGLLREADHAMYRAKSSGKNRVEMAVFRAAAESSATVTQSSPPAELETLRAARKA